MATTNAMPQIQIAFKSQGLTAIQRSERGKVVLMLKDAQIKKLTTFRSLAEVESVGYAQKSVEYLKLAFLGNPNKVVAIAVTDETLGDVLKKLENIQFDYLAMPEATAPQNETISSWIKAQRKDPFNKIYKFVAFNHAADHEGVINFASDKIMVGEKSWKGQEYTARIAGILAGLSLQQSATFYELTEVDSVEAVEDLSGAVSQGKLVLFNDAEIIRIARAVNSLTTITAEKGIDFTKIKIVEAMDLISNDIRSTFYKHYVGKVLNSYDNKQQFLANINLVYFKEIAGDLLEPRYDNRVSLDLEAQKRYAITKGEDIDMLTEMDIKQYPTGSQVMLSGRIKLLDAMEDLTINFNI